MNDYSGRSYSTTSTGASTGEYHVKLVDYSRSRASTRKLVDYSASRAGEEEDHCYLPISCTSLESSLRATRRASLVSTRTNSTSSTTTCPSSPLPSSSQRSTSSRRRRRTSDSSNRRRSNLDFLAKSASAMMLDTSETSRSSRRRSNLDCFAKSASNVMVDSSATFSRNVPARRRSTSCCHQRTAGASSKPRDCLSTSNHAVYDNCSQQQQQESTRELNLNQTSHSCHNQDCPNNTASTPTPVPMAGDRRKMMNWLANNAPKRNLKESERVSKVVKVIYAKGKEPEDAHRLADIPEDYSLVGQQSSSTKSLTIVEEGTGESSRLPPRSRSEQVASRKKWKAPTSSVISLKTHSDKQPKVAATTRRRSSTSFVAGSQIRTYNVVC